MSVIPKSYILVAAVVLLTIIPLLPVNAPVVDADRAHPPIFSGTDSQAEGVIQRISPDYQPWFNSLFTPPSSEIESLLFALQAALGAAVIGYYAGYVRGRKSAAPSSSNEDHRAH